MTRSADRPPGVVEFGLLGPFEVRVDGRAIPVVAPKCRSLLAALLLQAGQPVPVWDLAETIWGDAAPAHPRKAVQLYVTRLRQIFDPVIFEPTIIRTHLAGYQIDVPPSRVDVGRFEQWLATAARAADNGDLDTEEAALAGALGQWRGEPLAAVPSERLHRDIAPRLNELRLHAMEQHFVVQLRRGRHAAVIDELSVLTERHPLREGLWVQLITALHARGHRADALATYNKVRRILADELGVEPSGELQALHATILADGSMTRSTSLPPVPRQLPPDSPAFIGRDAELARLDALLDDTHDDQTVVAIVSGMAGVGKTALVNHWARRAADQFPDGQLWVDLRGYGPGRALRPEQVLDRFLRVLGISDAAIPLDVDDRIGLYRTLMDGRRMLVVLDNAADAAQVQPLVPGAPGCLVVVTSRNQIADLVAAQAARPIILDLLSRSAAHQLLVARLGAHRLVKEPETVEAIIDLCGRLPLALSIIAARAATHPGFGLDA